LTLAGLQERDRIVFTMAKEKGAPVAVTLAGGYARNVDDTVAIHVGTVRTAMQLTETK
jgi:acetoin utilization deacetylase AcuC-like enzyme